MVTKNVTGVLKSVTKETGTNGEYLKVEHQRPGMKYVDRYMCFNWDNMREDDLKVNQTVTLVIQETERLNSNGRPYWNLVGIGEESIGQQYSDKDFQDAKGSPSLEYYEERAEGRTAPPPPPPVPQALGACQNHAMAFIESGIIPVPEGRDPLNFQWELRDKIYREVNQSPYQADPNYCYQHQQDRRPTQKGTWVHQMEEGRFCAGNGYLDGEGNPFDEDVVYVE